MLSGNTSKAGDDGGSPDESFLFLLTDFNDPGIESSVGNAAQIQANPPALPRYLLCVCECLSRRVVALVRGAGRCQARGCDLLEIATSGRAPGHSYAVFRSCSTTAGFIQHDGLKLASCAPVAVTAGGPKPPRRQSIKRSRMTCQGGGIGVSTRGDGAR